MANSDLIYIPKIKLQASFRLLCFSYAGGNSSTYIHWQNHLHPEVELVVIQLPGRGIRLLEQPYQSMSEIVEAIFSALIKMNDKPFIFYGHSMGARVAYELILFLYRFNYQLPVHFIASGSTAPCISKKEKIYHLADNEFIKKLGELNGSPEEILNNHEIMQLILPALRADFKIIENYCSENKIVIPTTISVLAGDEEDVDHDDIKAWFTLFKSNTGIHWIEGDHFFIEKNRFCVLEKINKLFEDIYLSHKPPLVEC